MDRCKCPETGYACRRTSCTTDSCHLNGVEVGTPPAPTLEQLDAERYRKLRKWAKATSDIANGGALCFILDIDWGAIKDGDDADMLDAAIDAEP